MLGTWTVGYGLTVYTGLVLNNAKIFLLMKEIQMITVWLLTVGSLISTYA